MCVSGHNSLGLTPWVLVEDLSSVFNDIEPERQSGKHAHKKRKLADGREKTMVRAIEIKRERERKAETRAMLPEIKHDIEESKKSSPVSPPNNTEFVYIFLYTRVRSFRAPMTRTLWVRDEEDTFW